MRYTEEWVVLHIAKTESLHTLPRIHSPHFFLDTCQRQIWLGTSELKQELWTSPAWASLFKDLELFTGREASHFLLQLTCGLKSQILGETDVFGQFKAGWNQFVEKKEDPFLIQKFFPKIQKILKYTKEIRTLYLQNLGGTSYGGLVRKFLTQQKKAFSWPHETPLLLIGGGQLAQTILPFLSDYPLFLWNRTLSPWETWVKTQIQSSPHSFSKSITFIKEPNTLEAAWKKAHGILFCIPGTVSDSEEEWRQKIQGTSDNKMKRLFLHLGLLEHEAQSWKNVEGFYSLSDLFHLEQNNKSHREEQIQKAQDACRRKAAEVEEKKNSFFVEGLNAAYP